MTIYEIFYTLLGSIYSANVYAGRKKTCLLCKRQDYFRLRVSSAIVRKFYIIN